MKKTFVLSIVILLLLSVFITGCGSVPQPTEPVYAPPEATQVEPEPEPVTDPEPKPSKVFGVPESYVIENDGVTFTVTFWSGKRGFKGQGWGHPMDSGYRVGVPQLSALDDELVYWVVPFRITVENPAADKREIFAAFRTQAPERASSPPIIWESIMKLPGQDPNQPARSKNDITRNGYLVIQKIPAQDGWGIVTEPGKKGFVFMFAGGPTSALEKNCTMSFALIPQDGGGVVFEKTDTIKSKYSNEIVSDMLDSKVQFRWGFL